MSASAGSSELTGGLSRRERLVMCCKRHLLCCFKKEDDEHNGGGSDWTPAPMDMGEDPIAAMKAKRAAQRAAGGDAGGALVMDSKSSPVKVSAAEMQHCSA